MNNSNKNQIFKELYQENNNNFKIVDDNDNYIQSNNLDIQFKPIINCCYLTKDKIMLLNNSDDMNKIKIIQNKTKIFLKNKNKINNNININNTNESLNENISSIKDSLNINNFNNDNNYKKSLNTSLKTLSNYNNIDNNKTQNNSDDDIKNYSENKSHTRKRIISKLDSLQSIHNLTINKDGVQFFDNIIGNYDDSSSSIKENINNNNISISKNNSINNSKISMSLTNSINNIEKNINLRNKNRNKDNLLFIEKKYITLRGQEKVNIIRKIVKYNTNKNYYFEKINYKNLDEIIYKIKILQSKILIYLNKKKFDGSIDIPSFTKK